MNKTIPRRLLVSTRNDHKVGEIREILGADFEVLDLSAISGVGEVEETGVTFEENATLKAQAVSGHFDGWVIADDSGLEVDALDGAPGVWSARFSGLGESARAATRIRTLGSLSGFVKRSGAVRHTMLPVTTRFRRPRPGHEPTLWLQPVQRTSPHSSNAHSLLLASPAECVAPLF
jgi:non-canonical purine NTP pyrophosphatase (RdgB/HAM1 family)